MSKKEIEQLEKRIDRIEKCLELLEMETKELKSVDPGIIEERFKSIEETLYSTKEILSMKDVCHYLDISQSMLYKLTCNGEIHISSLGVRPSFLKRRNLSSGLRKKAGKTQVRIVKIPSQVPNDSCSNEKEDSQEEQH